MFRFLFGVMLLAGFSLVTVAKEPTNWRTAKVIHIQYELDGATGIPTAGGLGGFTQTARGEIDLECPDVIYTAEEWVTPNMRLRLALGDQVGFAIEKKTLWLKLDVGKPRKLKLIATYPKRERKP